MLNDNQVFIWAKSNDAHVQEPIEDLKQRGWAYGDTPAASNFNWLFKRVGDNFEIINKELLNQRRENEKLIALIASVKDEIAACNTSLSKINEQISQSNKEIIAQKTDIKLNHKKISDLKENHKALENDIQTHLDNIFQSSQFNRGVSRQICQLLREMEKTLRHFHPNFPSFPWPAENHILTAMSVTRGEHNND